MPLTLSHLEAFTAAGDPRFIFAARRDDPTAPLHYLEDGEGAATRAFARESLACFVEGCESPTITAVASARRRDHFRHLKAPSGGHSPESVAHLQGKALVARWLEGIPGGIVEVERAVDTQRRSIPDVLFTHSDGWRVAFEVQFAGLTVAKWRERHQKYVEAGVRDVWLWGAPGRNLVHSRGAGRPPVTLTDTQREIADEGGLVLWLHPELGEVAVGVREAFVGGNKILVPAIREAHVSIHRLDEFTVSPMGLDGPVVDELRAGYLADLAEHGQQIEAERARVAAEEAADLQGRKDVVIKKVALGEEPDEALESALATWFRLRRLGLLTEDDIATCREIRADYRRVVAVAEHDTRVRELLRKLVEDGELDGVSDPLGVAERKLIEAGLGFLTKEWMSFVRAELASHNNQRLAARAAEMASDRAERVWAVVEACWYPHEGAFRAAVNGLHKEARLTAPSWERLTQVRTELIRAGRLPASGVAVAPSDAVSYRARECLICGRTLPESLIGEGRWVHSSC